MDQHDRSQDMDGGISWEELVVGRKFGHKKMAEVLAETLDRAPSRTNRKSFWASRLLEGCIQDNATALEEVIHRPGLADGQQLNPRWQTISLCNPDEKQSNRSCRTKRRANASSPLLCKWHIRSDRCRYLHVFLWQYPVHWIWALAASFRAVVVYVGRQVSQAGTLERRVVGST